MISPRTAAETAGQSPAGLRALVVDDEPPLVKMVSSYLEREGFAVATTGDGRRAVELAVADTREGIAAEHLDRMTLALSSRACSLNPRTAFIRNSPRASMLEVLLPDDPRARRTSGGPSPFRAGVRDWAPCGGVAVPGPRRTRLGVNSGAPLQASLVLSYRLSQIRFTAGRLRGWPDPVRGDTLARTEAAEQ